MTTDANIVSTFQSRLRTLEFWIDNLNADFLLPILSRDSDLFSKLMLALNDHLRPAPYHYGLLTLRLLGKLGGKNRLFLQQPMDTPEDDESYNKEHGLRIDCEWNSSPKYPLPLPLKRAVFVLEKLSLLEEQCSRETDEKKQKHEDGKNHATLSEGVRVEEIDLFAYKSKLLEETIENQASSSFVILRAGLSALMDENDLSLPLHYHGTAEKQCNQEYGDHDRGKINLNDDLSFRLFILQKQKAEHNALLLSCKGLFHAANIEFLKDDALLLLEGLMQHMILLVANHIEDVSPTGDNLDIQKMQPKSEKASRRQALVVSGKLQPLVPFGLFSFSGELKNKSYCLILNEAIPQILKSRSNEEIKCALTIIEKVIESTKVIEQELAKKDEAISHSQDAKEKDLANTLCCSDIFVENLLHHLCQACLSFDWQARCGVYDGICKVLELMGEQWSSKFEVELFHIALFCLKDYPSEISIAEKEALSFFFQVFSLLYGDTSSKVAIQRIIDEVAVPRRFDENIFQCEDRDGGKSQTRLPKSSAICSIMIGELGSSNAAVRYAIC